MVEQQKIDIAEETTATMGIKKPKSSYSNNLPNPKKRSRIMRAGVETKDLK